MRRLVRLSAASVITAALTSVPLMPAYATVATAAPCARRIEPTSAAEVPPDVRAEFGDDVPVFGSDSLWVLVVSVEIPAVFDVDSDRWVLRKVVWYRAGDGQIKITGHRRDGSGSVRASTGNIIEAPRVVPSQLAFSGSGCWNVVARAANSTVRLTLRIPRGLDAICTSIASELEGLRSIPNSANEATAARFEAEARRKGCTVP